MVAILANGATTTFTSGQYAYTVIGDGTVKIEPADRDMITSATIVSTVRYDGVLYQITAMDFSNCHNLRSATVSSMYMTTLTSRAFANCSTLTSVTLSEDITEIGDGVFSGCKALKSLELPASVETIGYGIISDTQISSVCIPKTVKNLHYGAFLDSNLQKVEIEDGHPFMFVNDGILYTYDTYENNRTVLIYYPNCKTSKEFTLETGYINFPENAFIEKLTLDDGAIKYLRSDSYDAKPYITEKIFPNWYSDYGGAISVWLENLRTLSISASFRGEIALYKFALPNLETVEVDPENEKYVLEDGLLYVNTNESSEFGDYTLWKGLKYVLPAAAGIQTYVGKIADRDAFQWCTDIKEIFDFSNHIGGYDGLHFSCNLNHLGHSVTYYVCPKVDEIGYHLLDTKNPAKVVFLKDIAHCYKFDDWNMDYQDYNLIMYGEVYGPKNSNIRNFSNGKYVNDVNIITVKAPEEIEGILINSRPTPKFAVNDGETVTFSLPELPGDVRVFVNGEDLSSYVRNNTLAVTDVHSDVLLEIYTPKFLEIQYDTQLARVFIDGHEQSRINIDNKSHSVLVVPNVGYRIASMTLNEQDVTERLVNREIVIPSSEEAQILVVDVAGCSDARLSVENPDFQVAHYFNVGDNVLVDLTPPAGWIVNTVIFNDEDVTSALNVDNHYQTPALLAENVLKVSYAEDGTTGVDEGQTTPIKVFAVGHSIIIKNKASDESVCVYNIKGEKITETLDDEIHNLPHDVYIIHLESDKDYKIKI